MKERRDKVGSNNPSSEPRGRRPPVSCRDHGRPWL